MPTSLTIPFSVQLLCENNLSPGEGHQRVDLRQALHAVLHPEQSDRAGDLHRHLHEAD